MNGNKTALRVKNQGKLAVLFAEVKPMEILLRFIIGFVIGCAKIFGGLSPFAVGYVAACVDKKAFYAGVIGAVIGYCASNVMLVCVKYITALLLVITLCKSLARWHNSSKLWFRAIAAAVFTSIMAFACDYTNNAEVMTVIRCIADGVAAGSCTYFFGVALSPWSGRLDFTKSEDTRHTVSVMILISVMIIAVCPVVLLDVISAGRVLACIAVLLFAYKGGAGSGGAAGIAVGVFIDAACAAFWYTAVYGLVGIMAGVFSKQGKMFFLLTAVLTNAVAVLCNIDSPAVPGCLYEMFISSVVFAILPNGFMERVDAVLPSSVSSYGERKTREYMRTRLENASFAFSGLYNAVSEAAGVEQNICDLAVVFDAAAEKVCRYCRNSAQCWTIEYQTTLDALNGMSDKMMTEGYVTEKDLPGYFFDSCSDTQGLINAINTELKGFAYRRQYRARLMNNQKAAFGQYADMAKILSSFASELSQTAICEPHIENRLRKYLSSKGISGDVAVYRGSHGRLRAELSTETLIKLKKTKDWLEELSSVLGVRLCTGEMNKVCGTVMAAEPLCASVGIASIGKGKTGFNGDNGAYFKTDEGILYVILSDGMGTGREADKYSKNAITVLERFLKAGIYADISVRILNDMLLLKNQDDTGCCTVDLVSIDLFTGKAQLFKYGACASYLKFEDEVERISGTSLACGLGFPPEDVPDRFDIRMCPNSFAVLLSDGVLSNSSDEWIFALLEKYDGEEPKALAKSIIKTASERYGCDDDMMALVIHVTERK